MLSNHGIQRRFQAKLTVNEAGDIGEQESDRLAKAVLSQSAVRFTPISFSEAPAPIQRKCATCTEEDEENSQIQRRESSGAQPVATTTAQIVRQVLNSPAQPLDRVTRNFMESHFDHDFGEVQLHTDAAAVARSAQAHAYTVEHDIVFAADYQLGLRSGRRLLAHELTRVMLQRTGLEPRIQRQMAGCQALLKDSAQDYEKRCF